MKETGKPSEDEQSRAHRVPHVLAFPFPIQGHVAPMLKLAELLSLSGLLVTFLNTDHNHHRLLRFAGAHARLSQLPGFRFRTISDGLPADNPRAPIHILDVEESMRTRSRDEFRELLLQESDGWPPVTCVVADGVLPLAIDVPEELGIPTIFFRTSSAASFLAYFCIPKLLKEGKLPFPENADMDELLGSVPSMESFLRRRDLPSFCRKARSPTDYSLQFVSNVTANTSRARALVFNTVESMEAPVLSQIRSHFPVTYTVGPLHALLRTFPSRSTDHKDDVGVGVAITPSPSISASLLQEDRACMAWLDTQPHRSVVYVSFGSITVISRADLLEIWHGLVNSGQRFLWVMRPDLVNGEEWMGKTVVPEEVEEGTRERGYIVRWAPQDEVLAHKAVGGFLTHSGWNSTLESVMNKVPMICWPYFADQQMNSRFVSEIWRIGFDMKDVCSRGTVEKMVRELMEGQTAEEMRRSVGEMAELARRSVEEGGSSYLNLEGLVQHIKSLSSEMLQKDV